MSSQKKLNASTILTALMQMDTYLHTYYIFRFLLFQQLHFHHRMKTIQFNQSVTRYITNFQLSVPSFSAFMYFFNMVPCSFKYTTEIDSKSQITQVHFPHYLTCAVSSSKLSDVFLINLFSKWCRGTR